MSDIRGHLRVVVYGARAGELEVSAMTSIQVLIPARLDFGAAKILALETIYTELDRYGLSEALQSLGLHNPEFTTR